MSNPLGAINMNLLVCLDALLGERNVTRAAQRVGISQSAMSHNLATLRSTLDDQLLVRSRDGLQLTPRAMSLVAPLREGLRMLEQVVAGGPDFEPKNTTRTFHIATADYLAAAIAPALMARFAAQAPGARLSMRPLVMGAIESALDDGDLDLVLGPRLQNGAAIMCRHLLADPFVCVMRADHPARTGDPPTVSLDAYTAHPHVLVSPSGSGASAVDGALEQAGRSRVVACRVASFLAAPFVVARTSMLLTAPRGCVAPLVSSLGLVICPPPLDLPPLEVFATWHQRDHADPAHQWLREVVLAAAAQVPREEG